MGDAEILHLMRIPGIIMLFHEDCQVCAHNDKRKWYCAAVQQRRKQKTDESNVQLTHQKLSLSLDIYFHSSELFIIIFLYEYPASACHHYRGKPEIKLF